MKIRVGKTALKAVLVLLLLIIICIVFYNVISRWETNSDESASHSSVSSIYPDDNRKSELSDSDTDTENVLNTNREIIYYHTKPYALREDIECLLLLGVDVFHDALTDDYVILNKQQTDFIFLLIFDKTNKTYSSLHINRDTMTNFYLFDEFGNTTGKYNAQITLAHAYGPGGKVSSKNTLYATSNLLYGMDIKHYVLISMDAIPILNDAVGGVEVYIEDDFTGEDDTLIQGETTRLWGQHALTFVRVRKYMKETSAQTNEARMRRQRTYLEGLLTAYKEHSSDSGFFNSTMLKVNDYMESDCTINQLSRFNDMMSEYTHTDYLTLPGETIRGEEHMEFYADEEALRELVISLFYEPYEIK